MLKNLTRILLICFVSAVLSSDAKAAGAPCPEADLPCLRLRLLNAEEGNDRLKLQLEGKDIILKISEEQLSILSAQNQAFAKAATGALAAANQQLRLWYESPVLWAGIGVLLGTVLTVLVGVVVSRTWHVPQPVP